MALLIDGCRLRPVAIQPLSLCTRKLLMYVRIRKIKPQNT